jgi:hypothetical protein
MRNWYFRCREIGSRVNSSSIRFSHCLPFRPLQGGSQVSTPPSSGMLKEECYISLGRGLVRQDLGTGSTVGGSGMAEVVVCREISLPHVKRSVGYVLLRPTLSVLPVLPGIGRARPSPENQVPSTRREYCVPGVTRALAPTRHCSPITAPSRTTAPHPHQHFISHRARVQDSRVSNGDVIAYDTRIVIRQMATRSYPEYWWDCPT